MFLLDRPLSHKGNKIETMVQAVILEGLVLEAVLLLDKPLSQRGNKIETMVQAATLEDLVLEVLFVITTISLAM